jgi:GT2 family glycosyltransferase
MPTDPALLAGAPPPLQAYDADILILSHHRLAETILAIGSAQAQMGGTFHVIVLDQNSPASMRAKLKAMIGEATNTALYAIDENLGVGGGRNLASALGHGRAIIALDNDAVFAHSDIAASACARFGADPALGAIGFRIFAADGRTLDETSWGYPRGLIPHAAERFPVTTFVGCGHAIARACWNELGGYDASLFFTWEEYEFSLRAIAAGWRIEHHGNLVVVHAVAPEARVQWNEGRWRRFTGNRLLICHDWHGLPGMVPHALVYLVRGLHARLLRETLRGIADAWTASRTRPRRIMPQPMRAYIRIHETWHRIAGQSKPKLKKLSLPRRAAFFQKSGSS